MTGDARDAGDQTQPSVSLRIYLADPQDDEANVRMRVKFLGTHEPSLTVVCCRLLDPRWKLEVEAMAGDLAAGPFSSLRTRR